MKRLKGWALALLFGLVVAAGASAEGTKEGAAAKPGEPITLTLAFPTGGVDMETTKAIVKGYEDMKKGQVKVNIIEVPTSLGTYWEAYFNKIQTMIASGTSPDVISVAIEGMQTFVKRGLALPLDSYMKADPSWVGDYADFPPMLQSPFVIEGKTYGFAHDWNNIVIHINTDMLKAANLPVPGPNWTLEDFLRYAKAMTGKNAAGEQAYGFAIPNYWFGVSGWLFANGGSMLTADMKKGALDSPQSIQVMQLFQDLIYKYKVAPVPDAQTDPVNLLMSGKVGMVSAGRWPFGSYASNKFTSVTLQYLPLLSPQRRVVFGVAGYPVLKTTAHPKEAYELSAYMSGVASQTKGVAIYGIPGRTSVMKAILPQTQGGNWQIFEASAAIAKPVESPVGYPEASAVLDRYMSLVYANEMDVPTAMKKASEEITKVLAGQ